MTNPLQRLLRRRALRQEVRRALSSGVGLYHSTWRIERSKGSDASAHFTSDLVAWCRDTLTGMRRPYGLDHVTLAVSVLGEDGRQIATASYGVLRPSDFYGSGSAEARIRDTLSRWSDDNVFVGSRSERLSAVLFSWGDLARELLPAG